MSMLGRILLVCMAVPTFGAQAQAAAPADAAPPPKPPAQDSAEAPYAAVLAQVIKTWPADVTVSYLQSSGGIPPFVTKWQVDRNGVGKVERTFDDAGHRNPEAWPVALQPADLKALLLALLAVDFEHARRPVPDAPVQFLSIRAGDRTGTLDLYGLVPPETPATVQEKVNAALAKLLEQARKPKAVAPTK